MFSEVYFKNLVVVVKKNHYFCPKLKIKMRKFLFLLFVGVLVACKGNLNTQNSSENKAITNAVFYGEKTLVSAHRAGKGLHGYPENCFETMEFLYKKGIRSFEIDIFETTNGDLLLSHDEKLGRTVTGVGVVSKLTTSDLMKERLVDDFGKVTPFKIPFLKKVLQWAKQKNVGLMLDFKKGISYKKVVDLVRAQKMQSQVVLISYSVEQAAELHQLAPEMLLSVSARNHQELDRILQTNIPTEKMVAFTGTHLSEKSLFDRLQSLKIPAILGTLGNLDKKAQAKGDSLYKEWSQMGIQVFSTDRPLEAFSVLGK